MASPHLAEQVGRVLDDRYRVIAPIGTGASAAVFLANDVVLRRRVAIKVLHAALTGDQAFLKRFQAEAHTAAALSHPNIMRVLDWGEGDEGPFLVLEYLGGGSFRSILDIGDLLTPEQAVNVGLQAGRALDYAHRRGLVHRDIKPANLLFDDEGRLAIADFGLARALAEAAWTEPGGAVLGTARYASPEQVRGQSLNGKSDVYALGLVLIEAVAGFVPFTADTTIATLMARLDAVVEMPDAVGPLGEVLHGALDPDPDQRIGAGDLVRQLEALATALPSPEKLKMPGAVSIDLNKMAVSDPTMLPGQEVAATTAVEATPLRPVADPPKHRFFPSRPSLRRNKKVAPSEPVAKPVPIDGTDAKTKKGRWTKKRIAVVSFLVFVVLVLSGGGSYALFYLSGAQRPVPQLNGMTLDQARVLAKASKIKLQFDGQVFSETVPNGQTLQETPVAGAKVHPRQAVHINVSKGPAPRLLPNEGGKQFALAQKELQDKAFVVKSKLSSSEDLPKGQVISQDPAGGEQAKGTEVTLNVSSGPAPRTVPGDLKSSTYEQALAEISNLQLKAARSDVYDDSVPVGSVVSTSPSAGAKVDRGSTVTVNVSKGPQPVSIPNLLGQDYNGAKAALEALGLQVNGYGPPAGGTVLKISPAASTTVPKGSSVTISYG